MKSRGFTIIELLVVTSIISTLSSIILASVSQARDRARIGAAIVFDTTNYRALGADDIIHFNFDEGSGNPVNASSPGYVTTTGCASFPCPALHYSDKDDAPTNSGYSLVNDGTGSVVFVATPPIVVSKYTLSAWIKPTGNVASPNYIIQATCFNAVCRGGGDQVSLYLDGYNGSGYTLLKSATFSVPVNIPLNKWTHVAVSYSGVTFSGGTNKFTFFVDGKKVGEVTGSDGLDSFGIIGMVQVGPSFVGNIDNAALYPQELK